ncbi:MAG: cbb3-type cytochrome c oxidase maturation protein CcoH [Chlorobi bacterium OLB5]|nr:MAG: cbb3-type cytochrome c oxidase maturation protein CcoH [Chlorobi bacterium OLB5]
MSWGKGIILVFVIFILGIGIMVYKSMTKNIDLVTSNYYEKELKYQEQIDKINNSNRLEEKLKIEFDGNTVQIIYPDFPGKLITGEISFYKPSDAKSDFRLPVETGKDMKQVIETAKLSKGMWKVQVNWAMDGKGYFSEEKIMVQ